MRPIIDPTDENFKRCLCFRCPSYNDQCMSEEGLYCAMGTSSCEISQEGCLCPQCSVHQQYELKGEYFCFED